MSFRMLIVDDSPAMRTFIRRVVNMAGLEPDEVLEASNGREALGQLEHGPVDVILSDINMPVMDGEQFLSELAQNDRISGVPVVIVSTDSTSTRVERALQLGACGYVRKPFTPEALRATLESALRMSHCSSGEEFERHGD